MIIEQLNIFGNTVWIAIDPINLETENGNQEQSGQFICYHKDSEPNAINYGESFKHENNDRIIFSSIQDAKDHAISNLSRRLYPIVFRDPLNYTKENLNEIMHKDLIIEISNTNDSDNITETLHGKIIHCTLAGNPPFLPATVTIELSDGQTKESDFFEMRRFHRPN